MAAFAKSGFQATEDGIQYWFLGTDNIANFLGPVASLEAVGPGEFLLKTTKNQGYRVCIDAQQLTDFRRFGGIIKPIPTAAFAEPPQPQWGFRRTNEGVFLSFGGTEDAKHLGPILRIEHLQDDRYALIRKNDRHAIKLTAESLADFARLGGTVTSHSQAASSAAASSPQTPPAQVGQRPRLSRNVNGAVIDTCGRFPLNWRGTGRPLKIGPYTIEDPMLYWSKGPSEVEEASCVDVSLPVSQPVVETVGAMGYWPDYRRISPSQRANYLAWLASGRKSDLQDIGYAFIFLYGLERRALLENQDLNSIVQEVIRLLKRYNSSGSFTGYLTRFLSYLIARTGLERLRKEWFEFIFQGILGTASEEILSLALGWHVKRHEPLSPIWAVRMARQHPRASQSVVFQRAAEQFQSLFSMKYQDRFGQGFMVQGSRRDRKVEYKQAANPSLLALRNGQSAFGESVPIPNVLGLQSQFLPLVRIWDECIAELKPVSRRLVLCHA